MASRIKKKDFKNATYLQASKLQTEQMEETHSNV